MRKVIAVIVSLAFILTFGSAIVLAEETTATETTSPGATPSSDQTDTQQEAGITPDDPLYFLDKMVESIQVALTFSSDGKAELLVSFANERLAEADIMTKENKQELFLKVMDTYLNTIKEANEKIEEAAQDEKDVTALLESISVTTDSAGQTVIKAVGVIPQESAESLKQAITDEVKKTIVVDAFSVAKTTFFDAKKQFGDAKEALKAAIASGDEAAIKAAEEELKQAEEYKDNMEAMKDQVEGYKEEVIGELKEEKSAEDKEVKEKEKVEEKIAKMEEIVKKQIAKREEIAAKVEDNGKAAEKIEENTEKQIERKLQVIENLKASIEEVQTVEETDEEEDTASVEKAEDDETIDEDDVVKVEVKKESSEDKNSEKKKGNEKKGKRN